MRRLLASGLATALAALPAQQPPVPAHEPASTEALTALLADLDARFARGDVQGYLATFAPDHPGAHALLRRQLERLLANGRRFERTSSLTTAPRQIGPRTVVRVRHTFDAGGHPFVDDVMLAVQTTAAGRLVPTFVVEIPAQWGCVRDDRFRCPPCNYEVGGVDGWLCVPVRPERARSLEAASFHLIGTDIACDVTVVIDGEAAPAATAVQQLTQTLVDLDAGARPGPVEPWTPPSLAAHPHAHLTAARQEVSWPRDFGGAGGTARFHVVALGSLQHVLLVRGSKAALHEHDDAVQALLTSYRVLQTDLDVALAAAEPLRHHTGGSFVGNHYRNERFGFQLTGPEGWQTRQLCGGAALRVSWTSPAGSRLWLTGYDVPPGVGHWCERTADRWLQQLLQRAGLTPVAAAATEQPWAEHAICGGSTRTLTCVPSQGDGDDAPRQRTIRVFLHDSLLLVADLHAVVAADEAAMRSALESLRRD